VHPSARTPIGGAAPPPSQVVPAIELLLEDVIRARAADRAPIDAWDRQYERTPVHELPWFTDVLDADLAAELAAMPRGRLLDIGTGPGTTAIFAAQNGFDVVATEVAAPALALARRRANGLPIAWVLDDFLHTRLWGRFDVAVDRGCLHCLPRDAWPRYADAVARLIVPGGALVLKVHAPEEGARHGTSPASAEELASVFGAHFTLARSHASAFEGTVRPAPKAVLVVLTRRPEE
jgi:SAM-dependent methyltransferase